MKFVCGMSAFRPAGGWLCACGRLFAYASNGRLVAAILCFAQQIAAMANDRNVRGTDIEMNSGNDCSEPKTNVAISQLACPKRRNFCKGTNDQDAAQQRCRTFAHQAEISDGGTSVARNKSAPKNGMVSDSCLAWLEHFVYVQPMSGDKT